MPHTSEAALVPEALGKRKLGVACDACRFRKVKCDRQVRVDSGHSSCSNCAENTMECVHTPQQHKKRLGKRLKMLHEQSETHSIPSKDISGDSATHASPIDPLFAAVSPGFTSLFEAVSRSSEGATDKTANHGEVLPSSIIQNGMFAALPSGSAAVFDAAQMSASISPSAQSDSSPTSLRRTSAKRSPGSMTNVSSAALLSDHTLTSASTNSSQKRTPLDHLSQASASQVGFVGGLLGIASLDKSMLDVCTQAYFLSIGSCIGFIRQEWWWPRYNAYFARYAGLNSYDANNEPLSELLLIAVACRGCGTTSFANRFELQNDLLRHYQRLIKDTSRLVQDGWDAIESVILMVEHVLDGKQTSAPDSMSVKGVFDVDVLSHEGLVRLMKKFELHLAKPFGKTLEGKDDVRHRILFWVIYIYDAIRSEAGRCLPLIQDEEITVCHDIPLLLRDDSRVQFRNHFVKLARICRQMSFKILSQRVVQRGVHPQDVIEMLDSLREWYEGLPEFLTWDYEDLLHISGPQDSEHRIHRTFLIYLYLGQWLVLSYSVKDHGLSQSSDAQARSSVMNRLDVELDLTLERQILVCDHGTLYGIIRLHPGMMQSWTTTWCWWVLESMKKISEAEDQGRLATVKSSHAFNRYQNAAITFINAVATCDSNPDTPQIVSTLSNTLRNITGERTMNRSMFDLL